MYTRPNRIYSTLIQFENYIDGLDVYNSKLLYSLSNPNLAKSTYTIKTPHRTDIIATDFYGSLDYEPYVLYQLRYTLSSLEEGVTIELITKDEISRILKDELN